MKALSIIQPWATLIIHGIKDVENRGWTTEVRGRIAIHASKSYAIREAMVAAEMIRQQWLKNNVKARFSENKYLREFERDRAEGKIYARGAIVGAASIVRVRYHNGVQSVHDPYSHWHTVGCYGFYLADPVAFERPIPASGRLGLWEMSDELYGHVMTAESIAKLRKIR